MERKKEVTRSSDKCLPDRWFLVIVRPLQHAAELSQIQPENVRGLQFYWTVNPPKRFKIHFKSWKSLLEIQ